MAMRRRKRGEMKADDKRVTTKLGVLFPCPRLFG